MVYLLDTHAVIWMAENSPSMPLAIKQIIGNSHNKIGISSVSLWEIAIKLSIGKLKISMSLKELIDYFRGRDFDFLQVEDEYVLGLSKLPPIHKDPFDRLLISTAIAEKMTIITVDENIQKYDVPWVW